MTLECQQAVQEADVVFSVVTDKPAREMLAYYNPNLVDLTVHYATGKDRLITYHEMADAVLDALRGGLNVCFAVYGHPLVFAYPTRVALKTARDEGYSAEALPGVSAEDCIFTDLVIDPAEFGCQSYCATHFITESPQWDPNAVLILWQVSIIGEDRYMPSGRPECRVALTDRLRTIYGPEHPAILYEAATLAFYSPEIRAVTIEALSAADIRPCCTVVIPPLNHPDLIAAPREESNAGWLNWKDAAAEQESAKV